MRNTKNKKVLVTGGSGFLGSYLVNFLVKKSNVEIVVFDRLPSRIGYFQGDITNKKDISEVFSRFGPFETVYHLASAMPDKSHSWRDTWDISVLGTANLIQEAVKQGVKSFVFTSTNVTYGIPKTLPVTEETLPVPLEIYGKSKLEAENILAKYKDHIAIQIIRCPVITGVGRLGLQSILYEFISENKTVYLLGGGDNIYQFVDAYDVCDALERASRKKGFAVYVIGGDGAMPLRLLYERLIQSAGSTSAIVSLPIGPAAFVLMLLDRLNISPIGVYQYTMLSRSIYADTAKIKRGLKWKPKKTNFDSFLENYQWYLHHKRALKTIGRSGLSSNRSLPKMGIFKLLKAVS